MTKKERIQEAYGKYWEQVEKWVDENGWVESCHFLPCNSNLTCDEEKRNAQYFFSRPKSLSGIKNNNGWIVLNSVEDLPKTDKKIIQLWFMTKSGHITQNNWNNKFTHKVFGYLKVYSHYQIVVEPQPPIY